MNRWMAAAAAATLLAAVPARAEEAMPEVDELAGYRTHRTYETPQNFALELRIGPYRPNVDDQFPTARPFETAFGDGKRVAIGAELDWQMLRIPYVGTVGPGIAWGYTKMSGDALISANATSGAGQASSESTSLMIMPMYAVGVLRVDVLAREVGIPFVPYGKAGVGYALWSASNDLGTSRYTDPKSGDTTLGRGHTWGTHLALGGMLLLDPFNASAAAQLDQNTGVNNTYIFFEWMMSRLDGFGDDKSMRVGTSTWVTGLAFEL